jgi:glycosyltransferase involved in cell wall biosynthesis
VATTERLCYILLYYDPNSDEHYYHLYAFLESLAKIIDLAVIVEKSQVQPPFENVSHLYVQKSQNLVLRTLELFFVLLYFRLRGFKRFYAHYSYRGGILSSLVTKLLGGETFYWNCARTKDFEAPWKFNRRAILSKLRSEWPLKLTLKLVSHLVTGTPTMADYYATNYGLDRERIVVLPNWVDATRFALGRHGDRAKLRKELGLPVQAKIVLFVHRLAKRKGAHYLLAIARRVHAALPDAVLVIVGDGPLKDFLQQQVDRGGLRQQVIIVGAVPNREVPHHYAAADLFLMPSEEEGFPRVLLEAMASGLPFVATDVGGVRDIIAPEQETCLVPVGDVPAISDKIIELLGGEQARLRSLAEIGRARVALFTPEMALGIFEARIIGRDVPISTPWW